KRATSRSVGRAGPGSVTTVRADWFRGRSSTDHSRWTSRQMATFSCAAHNRSRTWSSTCEAGSSLTRRFVALRPWSYHFGVMDAAHGRWHIVAHAPSESSHTADSEPGGTGAEDQAHTDHCHRDGTDELPGWHHPVRPAGQVHAQGAGRACLLRVPGIREM